MEVDTLLTEAAIQDFGQHVFKYGSVGATTVYFGWDEIVQIGLDLLPAENPLGSGRRPQGPKKCAPEVPQLLAQLGTEITMEGACVCTIWSQNRTK